MVVRSPTCSTEAAAKKIGVSRQTLHAWIEARKIAFPASVKLGQRSILLWSSADIAQARKFKGTLKRIPKPQAKK
jgi:predicted DNA-binding transcriptional regulator AlpA